MGGSRTRVRGLLLLACGEQIARHGNWGIFCFAGKVEEDVACVAPAERLLEFCLQLVGVSAWNVTL